MPEQKKTQVHPSDPFLVYLSLLRYTTLLDTQLGPKGRNLWQRMIVVMSVLLNLAFPFRILRGRKARDKCTEKCVCQLDIG